jgi:hypothetical protein
MLARCMTSQSLSNRYLLVCGRKEIRKHKEKELAHLHSLGRLLEIRMKNLVALYHKARLAAAYTTG